MEHLPYMLVFTINSFNIRVSLFLAGTNVLREIIHEPSQDISLFRQRVIGNSLRDQMCELRERWQQQE